MRLRPLVALAMLSCAVPVALAQTVPAPNSTSAAPAAPERQRQPLDANHDGVITREEAQARPGFAKRFDEIDTNHDGKIDRAEFRAFREQMKSRREQKQGQPAASASSG